MTLTDTLPVGFAELEADAKTDGHGHFPACDNAIEVLAYDCVITGFDDRCQLRSSRKAQPFSTQYSRAASTAD
jgi:hypothetical protein